MTKQEKYRKTMLERYGVDHNFKLKSVKSAQLVWDEQHDQIIEKRNKTMLERYGVEHYTQSDKFKEDSKTTQIEHYGSIEEAYKVRVEKTRLTKIKNHGDSTYHNVEQFKQSLHNRHEKFQNEHNCTQYKTLIEKYGQGWKSLDLPIIYDGRYRYISNEYIPEIEKYISINHNMRSVSIKEEKLYEFIKSVIPYRCYRNTKKIIKDDTQCYELDIYIPKLKIAIEFNGNYWHSDIYKDKYYHQRKTKLCYEKGIQLIHIYEFMWDNDEDNIKKYLIKLFNNYDCSEMNWIRAQDYSLYELNEPEQIQIPYGDKIFILYNEGKFIKKDNL